MGPQRARIDAQMVRVQAILAACAEDVFSELVVMNMMTREELDRLEAEGPVGLISAGDWRAVFAQARRAVELEEQVRLAHAVIKSIDVHRPAGDGEER